MLLLPLLPLPFSAVGAAGPPDTGREGPAIYLVRCIDEGGKRFVHWKYSAGAPRWTRVEVSGAGGRVLGTVVRPDDTFPADGLPRRSVLRLTPLTDGGARGAPNEVVLTPDTAGQMPSIGRIGIRREEGVTLFYNKATGASFHPRGFDWIPLRGDHAAFDAATPTTAAHYDPYDAEAMFAVLQKEGYNTVRVFLAGRSAGNPGIAGTPQTRGLYTPYLDNLADFVARGARHGVYTIFNFCDVDLPHNDTFRQLSGGTLRGNRVVLTRQGLDAQCEYVRSVLEYLKRKNPGLLRAVLGVQCANEMSYDLRDWPFDQAGRVTTANGKTYDMADPAQRAACGEDGWIHYYSAVNRVVKGVDPGLLTCEGIFVARAVGRDYRKGSAFDVDASGDKRCPPSVPLLARAALDFLDIHLYPGGPLAGVGAEVEQSLASSLYDRARADGLLAGKPVILGEFGTFWGWDPDFAAATRRMLATRDAACSGHGVTGFLLWTFDSFEQQGLYHAMADDGAFVRRLNEVSFWPAGRAGRLLHPDEAARLPLALAVVPPTGEGKGFLARDLK